MSTTEPEKSTVIADLIKTIEEEVAASANSQAIPAGTVLDDAGKIVKLGEENWRNGIIYGSSIELPSNIFTKNPPNTA